MFSDWTDPYDLDTIHKQHAPAYQQLPVRANVIAKPEEQTGVVVSELQKSNFEIDPRTITEDPVPTYAAAGPLGKQPEYNMLRSGPPTQEKFVSSVDRIDWLHVVLIIVCGLLLFALLQTRMQLSIASLMSYVPWHHPVPVPMPKPA
jgi:hypothetical protein